MKRLTSVLGILFLGCFFAGFWTSPVLATPTTLSDDESLWAQVDLDGISGFNGFSLFWNVVDSEVNSTPLPNLNYTVYWPSGYHGPQYFDEWSIPVHEFSHFYGKLLTVEFWLSEDDTIGFTQLNQANFPSTARLDEQDLVKNKSYDFLFTFYDIDSPFGFSKWDERRLKSSVPGSWVVNNDNNPNNLSVFFTNNNVLVEDAANYRSDFMPIPEPSTWLLLASGLGILLGLTRRKAASVREQL